MHARYEMTQTFWIARGQHQGW